MVYKFLTPIRRLFGDCIEGLAISYTVLEIDGVIPEYSASEIDYNQRLQ
ncbi:MULTISPECIES: hypothetical protein [Thermodesulfobacterium]|nr:MULTISPECIES: hypothetical protein [Thermodesulfobacterium]